MGPQLNPGVMVYEGAQLTLDLEPLTLGAHCSLIWSPCLLHGARLVLDLGPQPAPGAPMTHGLHGGPIGSLLTRPELGSPATFRWLGGGANIAPPA